MRDARPSWGRTALIGSTGFVGGVLASHVAFDAAYASATIDRISGETFDTVICAGAPATMWRANADPVRDLANLESLVNTLTRARIERLVLISTIAVLADPAAGADETTTEFETTLAYGRHRRWLETALAERFRTLILRLPAVFGPGLRKNFLFDLRHPMPAFLKPDRFEILRARLHGGPAGTLQTVYIADTATGLMTLDRDALSDHPEGAALIEAVVDAGFSATAFTHPDSRFQFYGLGSLADDISAAVALDLDLLHLAVEPWRAGDLCERLTGRPLALSEAPRRTEDMRTLHAEALGGIGSYLRSREQVIEAIQTDWDAGCW
ncbi:hypothetical protein IP78_10765 [Brevundimonas sp. AAP58]|uniref:NAD-dependent epimerase/dehydratase family protein n=1 Tax=Brevundimonas sp. AAP58 TaxID=1523422 RepID=UPI0006CC668D|nr:NAD-dependent epimerase/dehydratase family protein [Brevundimonas sp. AAP58]KPF78625.1 hypothetical protein IP78_10765 [Brevundimonas sp. AAP58]